MAEDELLVVEKVFDVPPEKAWKAITDKEQMKKWYFNVSDFKPEVGFEFSFEGGPPDKVYVHLCKVFEVEERTFHKNETVSTTTRRLSYTWKYKGYPGESKAYFVLFDEDNDGKRTRFRLVHEGLASFPQDNPDFARKNFEQGWEHIIGTSLKEFLEKN